jgi:hypothetical protein
MCGNNFFINANYYYFCKMFRYLYKVARSTSMPHIRVHGYVESTGPCPKVGFYFLGLVLPMAP